MKCSFFTHFCSFLQALDALDAFGILVQRVKELGVRAYKPIPDTVLFRSVPRYRNHYSNKNKIYLVRVKKEVSIVTQSRTQICQTK